jgi:hypothetical protein
MACESENWLKDAITAMSPQFQAQFLGYLLCLKIYNDGT